jgi:hypothetical protein
MAMPQPHIPRPRTPSPAHGAIVQHRLQQFGRMPDIGIAHIWPAPNGYSPSLTATISWFTSRQFSGVM